MLCVLNSVLLCFQTMKTCFFLKVFIDYVYLLSLLLSGPKIPAIVTNLGSLFFFISCTEAREMRRTSINAIYWCRPYQQMDTSDTEVSYSGRQSQYLSETKSAQLATSDPKMRFPNQYLTTIKRYQWSRIKSRHITDDIDI